MRRLLFLIPILLMGCGLLNSPTPSPELPTPVPTPEFVAPTSPAFTAKAATPSQPPVPYSFTPLISRLKEPVLVTHAADKRLFTIEKEGVIRIFDNGQLSSTPFLDIRDVVNNEASERGLLGLAFHPKYKDNGFFFVYYTDSKSNLVIARYRLTSEVNRADPKSAQVLVTIEHPVNKNHNGGNLVFAPDGLLYIGVGDGGGGGDVPGNAQNMQKLLGKILRLNVDDLNPKPEIWAKGLRNPWRFSFDRTTGDLYIGDVGQNLWEEIDYVKAPMPKAILNFGWNIMEGNHVYKNAATSDTLIAPIAEYDHGANGGCSVTGGYVYRGKEIPEFNGLYFYGDYCTGSVWTLKQTQGKWQNDLFLRTKFRISSFGEDVNGELYLVDHGGAVYKLAKNK